MTKTIPGNTNFAEAGPTPLEMKQRMAQVMEWIKNSTAITCEKCGNDNFMEIIKLRRVSGLVNGTGNEMRIPVPLYACTDCGYVNKHFMQSSGIPIEDDEVKE